MIPVNHRPGHSDGQQLPLALRRSRDVNELVKEHPGGGTAEAQAPRRQEGDGPAFPRWSHVFFCVLMAGLKLLVFFLMDLCKLYNIINNMIR